MEYSTSKYSRGFTIVELLIVIVVIGILAAITIVAYNGIQGRAQAAAVSSALEQTSKKLALYAVDNSAYPVDLTTAGINNTNGTSYQYSVNNSVLPQTYCVTATNGTTSYKISSTATNPTSGGCAGHGVGGVAAVTNLTFNPTGDASITNTNSMGNVGTTAVVDAATKYAGSGSIKVTGDNGNGRRWQTGDLPYGTQFGWSAYMYSTIAMSVYGYGETYSNTDVYQGMVGATTNIPANTWTRVAWTGTSLQGTGKSNGLGFLFNGGSGQSVWVDNVMATAGSSIIYNYADGNSANWIWNGTPNNSTSTGPAL